MVDIKSIIYNILFPFFFAKSQTHVLCTTFNMLRHNSKCNLRKSVIFKQPFLTSSTSGFDPTSWTMWLRKIDEILSPTCDVYCTRLCRSMLLDNDCIFCKKKPKNNHLTLKMIVCYCHDGYLCTLKFQELITSWR